MADQEVKTSIDALVAYLNEHGETNVTAVSQALGVNESVILGWANVLEKANILRIVYKSGRAYLSPVTGAQAGIAVTQAVKQAESAHLGEELESQVAVVNQVSARIEELSRGLLKIDEVFRTKYKGVKEIIDKINKAEGYIEGVEKKMEGRTEHIKGVAEKAQRDFETAQKYLASLSGVSVDTNNARAVSQELHTQLDAYDKNTEDLSKSLESVIYQYRKNALEVSRKIREKRNELTEILEFEDKQIGNYEKSIAGYNRESDAAIRRTDAASKRVLDDLAKGTEEIARLSRSVNSSLSGLRDEVNGIKRDLGGMADLNSGIEGIRKDLDGVVKKRDALFAELKKMQEDAALVDSKGEVAAVSPEEMKEKSDKVTDSVVEMNNRLSGMEDRFRSLGKGAKEKDDKVDGGSGG